MQSIIDPASRRFMLAARASGSTMLPPVTKSCGSPSGLSFLCSLRGGFSHPRGAGPARRAVSRGSACCWSCTSAGGGFALIALGRSAARARCPARDLATRAVVLNATLDRVPVLYLSDPCSRTQLAERRDDWMCGDECLVDEEQEGKHADIADAPAAAREVADAMRNAAPDLRDIPICLSSESSDGGEIIVIGDPGPDPKKACLKALGIRKMCEDETIGEKKMLADPEMIGVWTAAFVETLNMTDKLRCGFNDDDPEEEEAEEAGNQKQILALTKIMSDKLQKHFLFNFSDEIVTAPVIYGGYASDGSIVGVLSSRVWT